MKLESGLPFFSLSMMIALGMATGTNKAVSVGAVLLRIYTGPVCGGFLYHRLGYLAVFISAYVLVGIDLLFRILMLERKGGEPTDPISALNYDHSGGSHNAILPRRDYGTIHEGQGSQTAAAISSDIGNIMAPTQPALRHLQDSQKPPRFYSNGKITGLKPTDHASS